MKTLFPSLDVVDFTCLEQENGIKAALKHKTDVLALLTMGLGKTLIAILPSMLEDTATVVILPLTALMYDYKYRLDQWKVPFYHWTPAHPQIPSETKLILLSADSSKTGPWIHERALFHERCRPINRTVWDEAGLILSQEFRYSMRNPYDLRWHANMQIVVLSGGIPDRSIPTIREKFGLLSHSKVYRTPFNRYNAHFQLIKLDHDKDLIEALTTVMTSKTYQLLMKERNGVKPHALIFVPEITLGETVASATGYDFYHGELSDKKKQEYFGRWRTNTDGRHEVLIGTSCLGVGGDTPDVRVVIHLDTPRAMGSFLQEVNRGGRNGEPYMSWIIAQDKRVWLPMHGQPDHEGAREMNKMVWDSNVCIQFALTSWIDGKGVCCLDSVLRAGMDEEDRCICSRCKKDPYTRGLRIFSNFAFDKSRDPPKRLVSSTTFADAEREAKRRQDERYGHMKEFNESVSTMLTACEGICVCCLLAKAKVVARHAPTSCHPVLTVFGGPQGFLNWKKAKVTYVEGRYSEPVCFNCHLHSGETHVHFGEFKSGCDRKHVDVLLPLALGVWVDGNNMRERAEKHFLGNRRWKDLDAFGSWLVERPAAHAKYPTNLLGLAVFVYERRIKELLG